MSAPGKSVACLWSSSIPNSQPQSIIPLRVQAGFHEVKHNGYRTLLIIERRKARAYTRNGFDWTERYSGIMKAVVKLDCRSAIKWRPQSLIFCAFDLLHLASSV